MSCVYSFADGLGDADQPLQDPVLQYPVQRDAALECSLHNGYRASRSAVVRVLEMFSPGKLTNFETPQAAAGRPAPILLSRYARENLPAESGP